ncbi:MAG: hypothetical protein SFY32_15740 [Bacteroidota bacterium]|nr:hypothetical protein [Bacteroidota bacterium]
MKLNHKRLSKGLVFNTLSDVYYYSSNGTMATVYSKPSKIITLTNSKGEFKNYDVVKNTVSLSNGLDYSSNHSFIYYFLNNKEKDLGFSENGFKLVKTEIKDGLKITTWIPSSDNPQISKIELVHEKYSPIYTGFYDKSGNIFYKCYYSKYTMISCYSLPLSITEIEFDSPIDSTITKKVYSDFKVNNGVEEMYRNYKIPSNAKVVQF